MDANKLLKKLEEIKEDVYNNLSSSEKNLGPFLEYHS